MSPNYHSLCSQSYGLHSKKKNHTYYEQDAEKVALFLKSFNSLKHLAPVYIDETGFDTYFYREYGRSLKGQLIRGKVSDGVVQNATPACFKDTSCHCHGQC